ncbi:hypothetical protein EBZ80_21065 [bacterium]|nr:hypothetical protein [bacterium]
MQDTQGPLFTTRRRTAEEEAEMQTRFFEQIRQSAMNSIPPEHIEHLKKFGDKFHRSFDVEAQQSRHTSANEIVLEESLAYVAECVKAGLHPRYLTEDEKHLLQAGFGDEWWTHFGYTESDLVRAKDR